MNDVLLVGTATPGENADLCEGDETSTGVGKVELLGDGTLADVAGSKLILDGPESSVAGTGTAVFTIIEVKNCGQLAPGNSPGTLTLDGDLDFRGGVLEIEIDGLQAGQFDLLKVTGEAELTGGIVRFVLKDFFPQQGDQIRFLESDSTLTVGVDMRYEYIGALPGFVFNVSTDGSGGLQFAAESNAIGDSLFLDGFE